jgi:uncharacterized membrane protein
MAKLPDVNLVFIVAEAGIIGLFLLCFWQAWREKENDGGRGIVLLVSAAFFAGIFEDLNVRQLSGRGSYFYHDAFLLDIDRVPLFIILAWAIILWGAMHLSDAAPLPLAARMGSDAVWAVLLDLSFDVTAIRYEFWTWRGFGFDQAWFGVPAGNFFGWLWVSLAFASLSRALWQRKPRGAAWMQLFLVPPLGFLLYRALEGTTNFLLIKAGWTSDNASLMAFFAVFALLTGAIAVTPKIEKKTTATKSTAARSSETLVHGSRVAFHLFAVLGLLALPIDAPGMEHRSLLLLIAVLIGVFDWFLQKWIMDKHNYGS